MLDILNELDDFLMNELLDGDDATQLTSLFINMTKTSVERQDLHFISVVYSTSSRSEF